MRFIFTIIFFFVLCYSYSNKIELVFIDSSTAVLKENVKPIEFKNTKLKRPIPFLKRIQQKQIKGRKLTAAILAFPFPFGIVGLHRIYLGTKPYVPVAYIATLGGVFGVLPLIDFFAIIFDKNLENYENNNKVLMWVK